MRFATSAKHSSSIVLLALVLGALCIVLSPSCSRDNGRSDPHRILYRLPDVWIEHLRSADEETLAAFVFESGFRTACGLNTLFTDTLTELIEENRYEDIQVLFETWRRLAGSLESQFHFGQTSDHIDYLAGLSTAELRLNMKLRSARIATDSSHVLTDRERLEKYHGFLDTYTMLGDRQTAAVCKSRLSSLYEAVGDYDSKMQYLRIALSNFRELEMNLMYCQLVGELGGILRSQGHVDSMVFYYSRGDSVARHNRMPEQAARFCDFYASHYKRTGRLSVAHDLHTEALELCREFKAGCAELRFLISSMMFHSELGCWDIVERLLKRSRIVQRECAQTTRKTSDVYKLKHLILDLIEARLNMSRRDVPAANRQFAGLVARMDEMVLDYSYRAEVPRALYYWAAGLLENNRPRDALDIAIRGLARSERFSIADWSAKNALLLAEIHYELGNDSDAEVALDKFDEWSVGEEERLRRELLDRNALRVRIRYRTAGTHDAIASLIDALNQLIRAAGNMDASIQSYLWLDECDGLRALLREFTVGDAELGYGAELVWRDLYRATGRSDGTSEITSLETLRDKAVAARARVARSEAIHCLYTPHRDDWVRWTVSSEGIRRDVIDVDRAHLKRLVDECRVMLSSREQSTMLVSLEANLQKLGRLLLPPEVVIRHGANSSGPILITAEGFLSLIPFEAFGVPGTDQYVPLIQNHDVAYIRYFDSPTKRTASRPGVIVVNSRPSETLQRRYPLQKELKEARLEGETIAALSPDAVRLFDEEARKSDLRTVWDDAAFAYFATHTIQDPQVPYLFLIPLAEPVGVSAPDETYLDVTDIREADLGGCELVALSGCSSGLPYMEADKTGPSLGDAFLDSGAGAVIQTFWDVRDDEAREFMTSYIRDWNGLGPDKIKALSETRREFLSGPSGVQHPSRWASYSIKLARLPLESMFEVKKSP